MKGFFSFDEDDFDRGYRAGREQRRGLMFHLTITTEDLDRFIDTPEHLARAEGYVRSDALGGGELAVERGLFNLFVDQEGDRRRKRMLYRLFFSDAAGHPLTLNGFKVVEDDPGIDNVWSDTSTLFTRLLRGHVEAENESRAELVGSGILHIHPLDFARQMTTFRTSPRRAGRRGRTLRRAVRGGALGGLRRTGAGGEVSEGLETTVVPFTAGDGLQCNVHHVSGDSAPTKGPVLLVHGAGVRANIFRPPTERNLVQVLVDSGYDVWLENWRASIDIPHNHWTLDQAAVFDHPEAVKTVAERTGAEEIQAVIHCQGSTSFMMSAVSGLVPEVTTIVSNAVALHPIVSRLARIKMDWVLPPAAKVLGYLNPQWGVKGAPWVLPKAISAWVKLTHHECDNDVCKLSSYTYGVGKPTLWRHENLNAATHSWLTGEFADVPLTFFEQMGRCVKAGSLVSVEGRPELPRISPPSRPRRMPASSSWPVS